MLVASAFVEVEHAPFIEYDPYVPLTITWPRYNRSLESPTAVLLRGSRGHVEVKFNADDGELVEIVVPSAAATDIPSVVRDWPTPSGLCVPAIRVAPPSDTLDAPDLRFEAYRNGLKICFCDQVEREFVGSGPVFFGMGEESSLVSMMVAWNSTERQEFLSSCFLVDTL
jgi:hypothetical protein